jgi:hypothetical protein
MIGKGNIRIAFERAILEAAVSVKNKALDVAIISAKKEKAFESFKKAIEETNSSNIIKTTYSILSNMGSKDIPDFVDNLYSKSIIETKSGPIGNKIGSLLFDISVKGIGKGEVYCAWLYTDTTIQGGKVSFDILQDKKKYEVKEYLDKTSAIRIGVEGSVSKFSFWKEILNTVNQIVKIQDVDGSTWDILPQSPDLEDLKLAKDYIINRVLVNNKIVTGEFGKKDLEHFSKFYTTAKKILADVNSTSAFNQVVLRGPNVKPKSITIDPITVAEIPDRVNPLTVTVQNSKGTATIETLINFLSKLKYLRNPEDFQKDIDIAVAGIIEKGEADFWVIYRGSKSSFNQKVISKADAISSFKYNHISQNGIKFKEPGI